MTEPRTAVRDLAFGITAAAVLIGLAFFASFGLVEAATLAATVIVLIWVATVDAARLVDERGRPAIMLFGLGAVGVALIFTAATLISTVTEYLALAVAVSAYVVGLVRAIRFGWATSEGR